MKLEILTPFRDKDNFNHIFNVGEIVEFDQERSEKVIGLGYAKPFTEETPNVESPKVEDVVEGAETKEVEESKEEAPKRRGRKSNQ